MFCCNVDYTLWGIFILKRQVALEPSRLLFHKRFRYLHFDESIVSEGQVLIIENIPELIRDIRFSENSANVSLNLSNPTILLA